MSCGAVVSGADADAVIARCRQLNTDRVALARDTLPGFDITTYSGVPDPYFLKETVQRIGEAGIEVYAVSKPYCMGKDMDVIRNPAAHRREIDEMLATVDVVAGSGIPVMLQYAHVDDPEDPAEDEDLWGCVATIYREVVAQAETSGLKLANHGRWPTPDASARARASEQGIGYEDYRRFRVPEWEGPFMIRDGDHIARLVEQEAPSPNHGVCMCAGMGMNGPTCWRRSIDSRARYSSPSPETWHVAAGRGGNARRGRHRREGVPAKAPCWRLHRPRPSGALRRHETSQRGLRGRRHRIQAG